MAEEIGLLDALSAGMNCTYLSDLRFRQKSADRVLAGLIRNIPVGKYGRREWTDALEYLTGENTADTAEEAREKLLAALSVK